MKNKKYKEMRKKVENEEKSRKEEGERAKTFTKNEEQEYKRRNNVPAYVTKYYEYHHMYIIGNPRLLNLY